MDTRSLLRALPKTDDLLRRAEIVAAIEAATAPRPVLVDAVRDAIEAVRAAVLAGEATAVDDDAIVADALDRAAGRLRPSLRPVINATGIIVHTNLGRSPLAREALDAVAAVAAGYSTLEYDVDSGERGSRHTHVERLICEVTGAPAAMAVNNNAAATLLGIAALSAGREAIVSRGQLVEIGGSFRIPDIMRQSGATMVEVGTTNKTHLRDYEAAIGPDTGLLLKVHSSNFRVVGFVNEVPLAELVELGRRRGVPVFEDQGSGVLLDLAPWGLPGEPTVRSAVEAGADLVSVSGDKLLGGPQAGILAGGTETIARLKRHPLARALRLDKMTLAALEATLRLYLDPERARERIPTLAMLTAPAEAVALRAAALADAVERASGGSLRARVADDVSRAGGGALPMADIPTAVVEVRGADDAGPSANAIERALRLGDPCIVARIRDDAVVLDPRTLLPGQEDAVAERLGAIARGESPR